ncbi:histone acetyltransferase type B catalytic subunit [Teleopsis dalmanni]|uniref:histone acetyltransferase type B catalytic subunit n=1 Tax=Teleopsis dalmanni TaxID=139649 RepID=UPI0018CE543C|nr:histone acetyltransferase type B catalytic subunit [Teleopsis dalmanni]
MTRIHDYEDLVLDALEVVEFKLIRDRKDVENDAIVFHPAMAHQIFGESESIFGYQDLKVHIYYTAGPLHIYVGTEHTSKVDELSGGDIKADDVVGIVAEKLPAGCCFLNIDEFLKTIDRAEKFQPFGEKLTEYKHSDGDGKERLFEIYHCTYKSAAFLKFFARLQTFVLWFVDAASYIDVDDPQWHYFVCYEKYTNDNAEPQYATVAYTTVYEYYAYPQNVRPRISQMLVLPPFQKRGVGTHLIETIYKFYQAQKTVIDITVEDPSDEFQRLRNCIDARLCKDLKSFSKEQLLKGFSKEMITEARETLKINPRQCRKIYEILRLMHTNIYNEEEYKDYRLDIKKRLNAVYHKQLDDIKKMEKAKFDTEWLRARIPILTLRMEQLQEEFEAVVSDYKRVIEKLNA